jgi:plasmid stability protein
VAQLLAEFDTRHVQVRAAAIDITAPWGGCGVRERRPLAEHLVISSAIITMVSDVLIRDVPDDVLASLDARAARMGLSRTEYIRRRLAQDAQIARVAVTAADLQRFAKATAGLGDAEFMREAWE